MHKVLVVDDDKVLQQSVKQALEYHHFNVDVANNGREAVNAVYREKYDLVVMDVNMPVMNGFEAAKEIKKLAVNGEIKDKPNVVAVTAYDDEDLV